MNAMLQQFFMMPRFRFGVMSVAVNKPEGVQQGTAWKGEITSALQVCLGRGAAVTRCAVSVAPVPFSHVWLNCLCHSHMCR
jgi:hypothetical protein